MSADKFIMNRYLFYTSIVLCLVTTTSCKRTVQEDDKAVSINQMTGKYDSLIYQVKTQGDTNAYDELFHGFIDFNEAEGTDSILRYSKIMAENFKYERAYYDYLKALCKKNKIESNWSSLSELDLTKLDETSKIAIIDCLNQMLQNKIITQEVFNSVKK
jgi:hypothetical protein